MTPAATYSFLEQAAAEARAESRRHWAKGDAADKRFPVQPEALFWPIETPADPEGLLFINPRGVRVLCAVLEYLIFGDVEALRALIEREIDRAPAWPTPKEAKETGGRIRDRRYGHAACVAEELLRAESIDPRFAAGLLHAWNRTYCRPAIPDVDLKEIFDRIANREADRLERAHD